jgi:hypothetical protein
MASIRRLKKDIDYLTFAVIGDSLNCLAYGKSTDEISAIVENMIETRNGLRQRATAGKAVEKRERKAYYRQLNKDLMVSIDGAFSKLSELVKEA